jgi:hypothetical protein
MVTTDAVESPATDILVTRLDDGRFDIAFSFRCSCGSTHRGHEVSHRPVRFVTYVLGCGDTVIVFDYKDAQFVG